MSTSSSNNNNNAGRSQARSPQWQPGRPGMPVLGEVRYHRRTGLMYIYDLYRTRSGQERVGWLRYDTWVWRALGKFPNRTARPRDLRKFDRRTLGLNDAPATFVELSFK